MKALTLSQPWATLVSLSAKRWETRSRNCHYRGELAIAASAGPRREAADHCSREPFARRIGRPDALPFGAVLAVVQVTDAITTEEWLRRFGKDAAMWEEFCFGDYGAGRFAWKLEQVRMLHEPVPCKGALGLWTLPDDVEDEVRRQARISRTVRGTQMVFEEVAGKFTKSR